MVRFRTLVLVTALATAWIGARPVQAHFLLLKPDSWLNEGADGSPQKGGPCGPGGYDDVSPIPTSGKTTTFHAGEMIDVEAMETVHHPGYFRVSIAETDAAHASKTNFPDPPLDDPNACTINSLDAVPTGAHDNVLADGLFKDTNTFGANRDLMTQVKLPDKPCDHCTVQVVQVMEDHGPPNCYYYHCADITILPAGASADAGVGTGGAGAGSGGAGGMAGSGGMGGAATGGHGAAGMSGMSGSGGAGTVMPPHGGSSGTGGGATITGSGGVAASGSAGSPTTRPGSNTTTQSSGTGTPPATTTMPASTKTSSGCTVTRQRAGSPSGVGLLVSALAVGSVVARVRRRSRSRATV
jgi:hypothetical protein